MINLPIFKKKMKCSYLNNNLNFSSLKKGKKFKIFLGLDHRLPYCKIAQLYLKQTTLICLQLALIVFFPICNDIFTIIDQCRFF